MQLGTFLLAAVSAPGFALAQDTRAVFAAPVVEFDPFTAIHTMADLDGDGDQDAVGWWWRRSNFTSREVHTFLNDGGRFTKAVGIVIDGGSSRWAMDKGRFNRDNRDDLVTWFGPTLTVYLSDANGDPVEHRVLSPGWAGEPHSLAVADFDSDGLDDLAVSTTGGTTIHLNDGNGFVPAGHYLRIGPIYPVELNGDSQVDLAMASLGGLIPLYVEAGAMREGARIALGVPTGYGNPIMPVFGDVDNDGDDDIVAFNAEGEYAILRRDGAESFALESVAIGGPATGLADVDGDGDLDGVCCGGGSGGPYYNGYTSTFHVSINRGGGRFSPAVTIPAVGARRLAGAVDVDSDGDVDLVAGRSVFYNRDSFGAEIQPALSFGHQQTPPYFASDLDGDGDTDVHSNQWSALWPVYYLENDGAGSFDRVDPSLPQPAAGFAWRGPGWRGDFDGDGDSDLIGGYFERDVFAGMRLYTNTGAGAYLDGGYATTANFFVGGWTNWFGPLGLTADFDGDGDVDLYPSSSGNAMWFNDGTGRFVQGPIFNLGQPQHAADVDGDGYQDVVFRDGESVSIAHGDGAGGFATVTTLPSPGGNARDRIAVADLDGDTDVDLAYANRNSTIAVMYRNDGNRVFTEVRLTDTRIHGTGWSPRTAHASDVDGDGHTDLILHPALGTWTGSWILRGDGFGGFEEPVLQVFEPGALIDVDGDGDVDVLTPERLVRNQTFGRDDGSRRQFGSSGVDSAGFVPKLGATGPFRVGERVVTKLSGVPGGTLAAFAWGIGPDPVADFPLAGMTAYASPLLFTATFVTGGSIGDAGTASLEVPYVVPPNAAGIKLYQQFYVLDLGLPTFANWTNGLELVFGNEHD